MISFCCDLCTSVNSAFTSCKLSISIEEVIKKGVNTCLQVLSYIAIDDVKTALGDPDKYLPEVPRFGSIVPTEHTAKSQAAARDIDRGCYAIVHCCSYGSCSLYKRGLRQSPFGVRLEDLVGVPKQSVMAQLPAIVADFTIP